MFNQFTPLPGGRRRATTCSSWPSRAGVEVGEVYEVDASRRTTAANAYVTGLGHTKRVVLYDTLLKDFTPAETRLVVAHELGHVRYQRRPARPAVGRAGRAVRHARRRPRRRAAHARRRAPRCPPSCSRSRSSRPALTTISNQLSRAVERRADAFALELTGEPDAMVGFERRITLQNVGDPDPPRWQQLLIATHPPTMERIGQALAATTQFRPVR